jgi:hypothetical protein
VTTTTSPGESSTGSPSNSNLKSNVAQRSPGLIDSTNRHSAVARRADPTSSGFVPKLDEDRTVPSSDIETSTTAKPTIRALRAAIG